ncbi:Isopentenyl-diphosphate delta-isomerase [Micrococcus lylae]|uniref:Isopentenyl-diphosphate Delta-isomerase n=1 Tax=Micrococcus lylae TaxID=1273 RepID=A0A1R4IWP7_9MICC|nr:MULTISPECIES: isopentenyl-diphosphate Delta-isomerase [Micrococcus]MCT2007577.1 isopentenyl-diphosphate Delta-isomerase [Micrococcus lylae]MCT2070426.1 isopentenyl-diphosphate Delta-isomerase [Micrococcus lylae]TFH98512.1 isopentenyl-diphosphate Delta-isomerase [Micrococcus lylae]WIK81588.1 isopentenyl-diphosphate Delta-isomerase [Micrococcus lylae]SJN24286.1 Isopentenyl-diphosphate delta-isomerase [Micrococcus lylae]
MTSCAAQPDPAAADPHAVPQTSEQGGTRDGHRDAEEVVVLLAEDGTPAGTEPKATVHRHQNEGTPLHLAFSCHVYGPDGRFLLTRRALAKKTFPGVWTNGFCGHPGVEETPAEAVGRRAVQELGVPVHSVEPVLPDFRYRAVDAAGVEENEICPVFRAQTDGDPAPVWDEVAEWEWVQVADLTAALAAVPAAFSPWLAQQWRQGAFEGR